MQREYQMREFKLRKNGHDFVQKWTLAQGGRKIEKRQNKQKAFRGLFDDEWTQAFTGNREGCEENMKRVEVDVPPRRAPARMRGAENGSYGTEKAGL